MTSFAHRRALALALRRFNQFASGAGILGLAAIGACLAVTYV